MDQIRDVYDTDYIFQYKWFVKTNLKAARSYWTKRKIPKVLGAIHRVDYDNHVNSLVHDGYQLQYQL